MCLEIVTKPAKILTGWKLSTSPNELVAFQGATPVGRWCNAQFKGRYYTMLVEERWINGYDEKGETLSREPYHIGFHAFKHLKGIKEVAAYLAETNYNYNYQQERVYYLFKVKLTGLLCEGLDGSSSKIAAMNIPTYVAARMKAEHHPRFVTKLKFDENGQPKTEFHKYRGE